VCGASAATLWKCFKELDVISKAEFKRQIARAIQTSSIFTSGRFLPPLCVSAFDSLFTSNVLSRRGFVRSCIASVVIVTIFLLIWYLSIPDEWRVRVVALGRADDPHSAPTWTLIAIPHYINVPFNLDIDAQGHLSTIPGDILGKRGGTMYFPLEIQVGIQIFGGLPFVYNLLADFIAVIITQRILRDIATVPIWQMTVRVVIAASGMVVLSFVALGIAVVILSYLFTGSTPSEQSIFDLHRFVRAILFPFYAIYRSHPQEWHIDTLYGVFVWSTLMGLLWLSVFSFSVIIANFSMRLKGVGPWLNRNFHVQRQPIKVIRAVAIILLAGFVRSIIW